MTNAHSAPAPAPGGRNPLFSASLLLLFAGGLFLLVMASIHLGASNLSFRDVGRALFAYDQGNPAHVIVRELRLPRAIAAVAVGAALAVAGAIMQGLTNNPLASPSTMGVTAGSTFFIAIALAVMPAISYKGMMTFSFIGAGIGTALVFGAAAMARGGMTPVKLALAGSAIASLLSSLSTVIALRFNVSKNLSYWFAGSVSGVQPQHVYFAVPFIAIGLVLALLIARSVTILSLGDDIARNLGQRVGLVRLMGTVTVLVLTGAAVSVVGMVAFVGLVIPHITRMLIGQDYRWIVPYSAVLGGALLIVADMAGRLVNPPFETPLGAITSLIGVPFFLYLARREGRGL
ncbi:FecCD family ABC transporter permease [Paenibacillus methanolicus]|uniref:Iron complex transport system permease protein n=1 Tax=Paenibacillus methanolicus TaxID=582686 RepID=A0A5S5BW76_9BACL|nr:iron ABC transporter permease [Paenibacillus methanolicus]TYP70566.1 iron complex transport system permease protein [Paenibacillus methanolicus]